MHDQQQMKGEDCKVGINPNRWKVLHIVNMGTFMSTLDVGVVNVVLPTLADQFSVSLANIQWVVSSYLLTMVALLPVMGKISDRFDRRKIYSLGFLIFSIGSLFIAFSPGLGTLIASRVIQGIGATMIMANSQAVVRDVFPDSERGKALGINAIIISIGTLSGPAIGGVVMEFISWKVLFLINVPLGVVATLYGLKLFPKIQTKEQGRFDFLGSFLLAIAISVLLYATVRSEQEGFTAMVILMAVVGLLFIVCLYFYERKIPHAIIDKVLFTNRAILIGNSSAFLIYLVNFATLIPITFYMQDVLKYPTSKIGLFLAVQPVFLGIVAPIAGKFRDRFGVFLPVLSGSVFCAVSTVFIAFSSNITAPVILLFLAFFGLGMGLFQAANNADIMTAAPASKISLIGSMLALIRYLGMIVGTGLATFFVGSIGLGIAGQQITSNIQLLFMICFFISLVAVCLPFFRPREPLEE